MASLSISGGLELDNTVPSTSSHSMSLVFFFFWTGQMPIDGLGEKHPLCMSLLLPGGEVSISISLEGVSNDLKVNVYQMF